MSRRANLRAARLDLAGEGRGHPPPVCPRRHGPRDELPPGGAINKRFPSKWGGVRAPVPLLNISNYLPETDNTHGSNNRDNK